MTTKHFFALMGFLFVAAWVAFNFGYAVLCLVGAVVFYFAAQFAEGGVDIGDLQSRLGVGRSAEPAGSPPPMRSRVR